MPVISHGARVNVGQREHVYVYVVNGSTLGGGGGHFRQTFFRTRRIGIRTI